MNCTPGSFNLDGSVANGCELVLDSDGIYVSVDGTGSADDATCGLGPVGTGAGNHPCVTIARGIARATALARSKVLVANGIYSEAVTMANGISLLGAYRADNWVRDLSATGTVVSGVKAFGIHDATIDASGITAPTILEGFAIYGSVNTKPRGNSYAIYASGSSNNLAIQNNVILAGRGGPGTSEMTGLDGSNGADGQGRNPNFLVNDPLYDAKTATGMGLCPSTNDRVYVNHGATSCGGDDVSGGDGGGTVCPASMAAHCIGCQCNASGVCGCISCTFDNATPRDGMVGQPGAGPAGGLAGLAAGRGDDSIVTPAPPFLLCPKETANGAPVQTSGRDGGNGSSGGDAPGVGGCSAASGAVVGGHWVGGRHPQARPHRTAAAVAAVVPAAARSATAAAPVTTTSAVTAAAAAPAVAPVRAAAVRSPAAARSRCSSPADPRR